MVEFESRIESSLSEIVEDRQATGRDSSKRSVDEHSEKSRKSTEVIPKKVKRRFSAAEKLCILTEADRCTKHGELGALLRREGLYSSQIAKWRLLRDQGELVALTDKKRGRKADANPLKARLAEAEKKNAALTKKLEKAHEIIEVQKKIAALLGNIITLPAHLREET